MVRRLAERRMNHPVASERFARHALGTRYDDLSDDAVLQAKTFILDTIGVGIAGSSAAGADELSQVSAGWGEGAEACVWGRRKRVPAPTAAFLKASRCTARNMTACMRRRCCMQWLRCCLRRSHMR